MNTHDPQTEIDSYPLDDATQELMAESLQQIKAFHAYREGVLALFSRQHKLSPGDWQLSANGKEMVRVDGRNRVNGLQAQRDLTQQQPHETDHR